MTSRRGRGMKIEDAERIFCDFSFDLTAESGGLLQLLQDDKVAGPIPNGNYLDALRLTNLMFEHTQKDFRMLTGGSCCGFLTALDTSLREMLTRIRNAGGTARAIVVNGKLDELECLLQEFGDVLKVTQAVTSDGSPVPHFIVADDRMVRDEAIHEKLEKDSPADIVKANVYFTNPTIAKAFSRKFEELWNMLAAPQLSTT